jgi:hypothetical protein
MNTDEIEIVLANAIHEINRLSSSIESIRQTLGEVLEKRELSSADRARLKELLSQHRSDAQSLVLFEAGRSIRRRFETEQTALKSPLFQAENS